MPKKLYISSNERIDKLDFDRSSKDYTQEADRFARQKLLQARQAVVVSGFRIELSDQAVNPGEFTIYNGVAIDRAGALLNNEQQLTDSRTFTLSGANLPFYIEVEFVETPSDVDARAFWDPTFSGNTPKGKEFNLNIATRLTPDWQLVNPVSIVNFDVVSNPNSNLVPVAVLTTDASNQITGITLVNAATVLEEDVTVGVSVFKVLDSTLFPIGSTATLGVGTANSEPIDIIANDYANGLISILNPLINSHQAGAILKETGVVAAFTTESTLPIPTTGADRRRSLYKGDEIRGSALSVSKESASDRADLDIKSLKDYIDFEAAQRREMKFGSLRSDVNSSSPPISSDFSSARHYDYAGSIVGAKTHTVTIGDNVASRGDLNSTSNDLGTIIQLAHNALPSTGGSIFVKAGTYVWDSTVIINKAVTLEFDSGVFFAYVGTYATTAISLNSSNKVEIIGMPDSFNYPFSVITGILNIPYNLVIRDSIISNLDFSTATGPSSLLVDNSILQGSQGLAALKLAAVVRDTAFLIQNSTIRYADSLDDTGPLVDNCTYTKFVNCKFDLAYAVGSAEAFVRNPGSTSSLKDMAFEGCKFISTNPSKAKLPFDFNTSVAGGINGIAFRDCYFDFEFDTTTTPSERILLSITHSTTTDPIANVLISNCDFSPISNTTIVGTSSTDPFVIIKVDSSSSEFNNCVIKNCTFGKQINGDTVIPHYEMHISSSSTGEGLLVDGNSFSTFSKYAISIVSGSAVIVNNLLKMNSSTATSFTLIGIIKGAGSSAVDNVIISNNKIKFNVNSSVNIYGIRGYTKNGSFNVSSNDIDIVNTHTGSGTLQYAVFLLVTHSSSFLQRCSFIGNTCYIKGENPYGIYLKGGSITAPVGVNFNVSSNNIALELTAAVNTIIGIYLDVIYTTSSAHTISSNTIVMESNSISGSYCEGITVNGNNILVKSNSIYQNNVDTSTGISFIGTGVSVSSNNIIQTDISAGTSVGSEGILCPLEFVTEVCKNCSVSDNIIIGSLLSNWGIKVIQGINGGAISGLSVSNNTIETYNIRPGSNGCIQIAANSAVSSMFGVSVHGNTCVEKTADLVGYPNRNMISVSATSNTIAVGVLISNNIIYGAVDSATLARVPSSSAAIYSYYCDKISIIGNVCSNWSDTTNSGDGISIFGPTGFITFVNVQNNMLSPVGASHAAIRMSNSLITGTMAHNQAMGSTNPYAFVPTTLVMVPWTATDNTGSPVYNTNLI